MHSRAGASGGGGGVWAVSRSESPPPPAGQSPLALGRAAGGRVLGRAEGKAAGLRQRDDAPGQSEPGRRQPSTVGCHPVRNAPSVGRANSIRRGGEPSGRRETVATILTQAGGEERADGRDRRWSHQTVLTEQPSLKMTMIW